MPRLMARLRIAKRRVALLTGIADMAGVWDLAQVTGALSRFAETALRLACDHLLVKAAGAGSLVLPDPEHPSVGSGLIILAMGKFGARELNYSSDIDLIVLYDDQVVQTTQPDNMARTFVRLARDLVRIMEERTRDGYVFRTDLRLRPDPGATPLAVSVSAAEAYYGSLGQNWERAAMIKARAVAGDLKAGAISCASWSPSSGAAAWISPPSRTSTRSSARSTRIAATRLSRSTAITSSWAVAASARSNSSPRPSS